MKLATRQAILRPLQTVVGVVERRLAGKHKHAGMARHEFDFWRSHHRVASECYRLRAERITELTKDGQRPPQSELRAEEADFRELAIARQKLLDGIDDQSR